jgi:hypothetical protein
MSTRSRANPWFRPILPIAEAVVDGIEADLQFMARMRDTEAMKRALIRSRLESRVIWMARVLDPAFDHRVSELQRSLGA